MSGSAAWADKVRDLADRIRNAEKYEDARDLAVEILPDQK